MRYDYSICHFQLPTKREINSEMFNKLQTRSQQENLLFVKSWNEWGEGNYLEPDLKYGRKYVEMTKQAIL